MCSILCTELEARKKLTLALASRAASASAAMALCNWTGSRTSLLCWRTNVISGFKPFKTKVFGGKKCDDNMI